MSSRYLLLALTTFSLCAVGCNSTSSSTAATAASSDSSSSDSGSSSSSESGGSGGTFTALELDETWNSGCYPLSSAGVTGETYYQNSLTFQEGDIFYLQQTTYSSSACNASVYMNQYLTTGTYTVGGIVSGSMQSIDFTVTDDSVTPLTSEAVSWWAAHAETDTFIDGEPSDIYGDHLTASTFYPYEGGDNSTISNVATLSGNTLTMGVGAETVPGSFGSAPGSATIPYTKE